MLPDGEFDREKIGAYKLIWDKAGVLQEVEHCQGAAVAWPCEEYPVNRTYKFENPWYDEEARLKKGLADYRIMDAFKRDHVFKNLIDKKGTWLIEKAREISAKLAEN